MPALRKSFNATVGYFRATFDALRALPGIGEYTAAAIAAIAFDAPAVPVDGNVERVVSRLFAVEEELPAAKPGSSSWRLRYCRAGAPAISRKRSWISAQPSAHPGARLARCARGTVSRGVRAATQETFPRKAPKREGQLRRGAAYVALRADGRVLLRTRPEKGSARVMTEVPGSAWAHDFDAKCAARRTALEGRKWRNVPGVVTPRVHAFPA